MIDGFIKKEGTKINEWLSISCSRSSILLGELEIEERADKTDSALKKSRSNGRKVSLKSSQGNTNVRGGCSHHHATLATLTKVKD